MNVFTEISTRELENTLKGKAVRYIVNDAGAQVHHRAGML